MTVSAFTRYDEWINSLTETQKQEWEAWMGFAFSHSCHYPRAWENIKHDEFEGYHLLMHNDKDCARCNAFRQTLKDNQLWPVNGDEHVATVRQGGISLFRDKHMIAMVKP